SDACPLTKARPMAAPATATAVTSPSSRVGAPRRRNPPTVPDEARRTEVSRDVAVELTTQRSDGNRIVRMTNAPVLVGIPRPPEHHGERAEQDAHILEQRPRRHVPMVEPAHLAERDVVRPEYLPQAGDTGLQVESRESPPVDVAVLLGDERTRADEAHLAPEHVHQLWELVEREAAKNPPDARHPRVVRRLEHALVDAGVLVQVCDLGFVRVGVRDHRPELEDLEPRVSPSHSHLPEDDGSTRAELDRGGDDEKHRSEDDERREREGDVHRTLEEQGRA